MTNDEFIAIAEVLQNALITFQGDTFSETVINRIISDIDDAMTNLAPWWESSAWFDYCSPTTAFLTRYAEYHDTHPRPETA